MVLGSRRRRAAPCLTAAAALAAGLLTACSGGTKVPSVGYVFDNVITTYNANTAQGAAGGAAAAFPRVLTGPFYIGPDGQSVSDTDYGTAKEVPGETQTVQYKLNPDGVYSDGVPTSCDDLVLLWAARSGRFPGFDAANTAGYGDIARIDCRPGAKDATVVFKPGRKYLPWRSLFQAGHQLPAHVAAKAANVPDVVGAVSGGDPDAIKRIADFWNTGWALTPGAAPDLSRFPSSGPYKIESFTADGGLVLVANDRWWGRKPATARIVLWPKNANRKDSLSEQGVDVVDIGANSIEGLNLTGFTVATMPSRNAEQLVLATGGIFANVDVRRALAQCVPRPALYDKLGHPGFAPPTGIGSSVLNSRIVMSDALIYPAVAAAGTRYPGGDVPAATAALQRAGTATPTVRVGYLGPDARRAKEVAMMADACKPAGITVADAGSAQFDPSELREGGEVDAILVGTAGSLGAGGTAAGVAARSALKSNSGTNFGRYSSARYDVLVDQLAVDESPTTKLNASVEAETLLWNEVPTIPLFDQPRTIAIVEGMRGAVANPYVSGTGWNMDRWELKK